MRRTLSVSVVLALLACVAAPLAFAGASLPAAAQEDPAEATPADTTAPLREALEANRHPVALAEGAVSGPGGELLIRNAAPAGYLLVGETHGVAEAPALMAALFRALRPHGYRHLAVEIGPIQAGKIDRLLSGPRPMEAYRDFLRAHWPAVPFFAWRGEAGLLADAVAAVRGDDEGTVPGGRSPAPGGDDVIWGLDYDILGGRYPLHRLRELAPDATAREAADRAVALADSLLARATETGEASRVLMFSGPDSVWAALRDAYEPRPGSEADRILEQLAATSRVNAAWTAGERWRSNRLRVRLLKRNFLRYREDAGPDGKVMVKMGGFHVMRGRTPNRTFDVGNLLSELSLAESRDRPDALTAPDDGRSFHVMVLGGPDRQRGALDPEGWGVREAPTVLSSEEHWARPLGEAAYADRWTVFDLRPLRPMLDEGALGEVPDRFEDMVFGFDAAVVLAGSTPAELLVRPGS